MKKTLFGVLMAVAVMVAAMVVVTRKGVVGAAVILLGLSLLLFGVTFLSELVKLFHGKKVQGRDRNP